MMPQDADIRCTSLPRPWRRSAWCEDETQACVSEGSPQWFVARWPSLRLAGRGPAPCGTGLRAALEPRRRRRRRPREWQSVRPGPERAAGLRGASQAPQRLLRRRRLFPSSWLPIHPPGSRAALHSRRRAAPAAAPLLLPRALAGTRARAGALAGSRLRAAAAAHDQEAAAPTGRRWRRRQPGPLQPRSGHPHAVRRAQSPARRREQPSPSPQLHASEGRLRRADPRPGAPRPGDHRRGSLALPSPARAHRPPLGRRIAKEAAGGRRTARPPAAAASPLRHPEGGGHGSPH